MSEGLALALHRVLAQGRELPTARREPAPEANRRPELRAFYDRTGAVFREHLAAMLTAAASPAPERQVFSLIAWADGPMFSYAAGSFSAQVPGPWEIRVSGCGSC